MWECVNALVGLRDVWWREVNCGIEKGRRETVEGSLCYMLKIRKLWLFMGPLCNTLIFRWCVVAAKKA